MLLLLHAGLLLGNAVDVASAKDDLPGVDANKKNNSQSVWLTIYFFT